MNRGKKSGQDWICQLQKIIGSDSESIQEFFLAVPEPVKEYDEYNDEGLPVPPDLDIKTLPSFTPTSNETGPVAR